MPVTFKIVLVVIVLILILVVFFYFTSNKRQKRWEDKQEYDREHAGIGLNDQKLNTRDVRKKGQAAKQIAKKVCPYPRLSRKFRNCKRGVTAQLSRQEYGSATGYRFS